MKIKLLKQLMFLAIMLSGSIIFAQTVTGTVTSNEGPVPGVNVIVKGTTNGVVTDFDGNYSIDNVGEDAILTFSFVGFVVQEIKVDGQSTINVTLIEDQNVLNEVVVTGYVTQTRGDISGSVSSVDMDEALKTPVANAAEALQGRVTGVTVVNSGAPGAAPKIIVRGFGTANNTDPLFIIDGVQTSDVNILNSINPADIDQMNVLKDGAAAIYGARASNGVIIVTTKSGGYNVNKLSVSLDLYTGSSQATNLPTNLNVQQHADMLWQSYANDGAAPNHPQYGSGVTPVIPSQLLGLRANVTVPPGGTNWNDVITQTAPTTNASLSLSNGSDTGKYYMSANYLKKEGILRYTGFERASVMVNGEFKIKDKVRIGEHLNVAFTNGNSGSSEAIENAQRLSPLIPAYDDDGNFAGPESNSTGLSNTRNALAQLYRGRNDFNKSARVFGDVYIEADLYEGLTFKSSYGVSLQNFDGRYFSALDPEHAEPVSTNTLSVTDQNSYEWNWSNTLTYNKSFGDHTISALLGYDAIKGAGIGKNISRTGYLFEDPNFYNLSNGSGTPNVSYAYEYENSLNSIFGNVNYNYQGKYFASVTVRNDKSSRFQGDNKSDTFPSFSAGWLISKEDFFPTDGVVDRFKIKGSYGELGNQSLPGNNPTINISSLNEQYANYAINGSAISTGAVLSSVGNPNLKWETSVSTNIGFELGLLDDRVTLSTEFFQIKTKDLIAQDFSLISTTAIDASAPYVNLGSVKNTGYDISLGFNNTWDSGWSFNATANVSHYKNEVTELISAFVVGGGGLRGGAATRTEVGRSISDFYGRVVTGLDDNGRFTYEDVNNDGTINDDDRAYIGSPHPDFTYGVNLATSYKGFDASLFFSGSQGNDLYNYEKIYTDFPTFPNGNRNVRVLDSWTPSNTNTTMPALSNNISNSETNPNSFFVEDGSYLRLKNIQIGYTLKDDVVGKLGMESVRLYAVGTNLFTITGYDGIDPEVVSFDNLTLGVDNQIYPVSSMYTIGINLKF